jgi:hypothetical protein
MKHKFLYEIWCLGDTHHHKAYQEMLNIHDHKHKNVHIHILKSGSVTVWQHFHEINNMALKPVPLMQGNKIR